ncbi:hypothetical protein [Streptomyces sp. NBC_00385]|uniref:hypothetical protein n=1 Tax=Streptomyces sp. NBC_00385 TaxID=2975733 RepID=UPI002DD80645|nr:hypothetical protein [Streptomyces sp. NBC_00385]WRZ04163.1 hypothetical protein OG959_12755 [Streptomyces sp. NBC_00385]
MTHAEAEPLAEVRIRAASDGRYVLYVNERQFHLLRRAAITLAHHEESPAVRQLVQGTGGVSLDEPLQLGLSYDDAVPGPVTLTFEQLHALHAVLTTLPAATIWPEPEFVERVGDFRETVLKMAGLLRWAFREQPVTEKEHG